MFLVPLKSLVKEKVLEPNMPLRLVMGHVKNTEDKANDK
jgi:hypothetical protein